MTKHSNSGLVDSDGNPIESENNESISESAGKIPDDIKMPEVSFLQHVFSLVTAARSYMGAKSFSEQETPEPHKGMAKYHIDTIAVLKDKCKGNLSKEEEAFLENALYELRRLFVSTFTDEEKNKHEKK